MTAHQDLLTEMSPYQSSLQPLHSPFLCEQVTTAPGWGGFLFHLLASLIRPLKLYSSGAYGGTREEQ